MNRQRSVWGLLFVATIALAACAPTPSQNAPSQDSSSTVEPGAPSEAPAPSGDPATWQLIVPDDVTSDSTTLEVEVTRADCANGVTGELLAPVITYQATQVIIRIDAEPSALETANCMSNDAVPVTVTLSEPVGQRKLIDGACLSTDAKRSVECLSSERASLL